MNAIKKLRKKYGFTQAALAAQSGLSIRTIQRLESGKNKPQGHTLSVLAEIFNVETTALLENSPGDQEMKVDERHSLKIINLSALAFFIGIPFGNLVLPYVLWRKQRSSKLVYEKGKLILNFQLTWTIVLYVLLCVSPFVNTLFSVSFPLTLLVLFIAVSINLFIICTTAISIQRDNYNFLNLPFRLI